MPARKCQHASDECQHVSDRDAKVWRSCKQQKGGKIKLIYMFILGFVGFGISRPLPVAVEKFPAEGQYLQTVSFPGRPCSLGGKPPIPISTKLNWSGNLREGHFFATFSWHGHKTCSRLHKPRDTRKMFCFADHEAPFFGAENHKAFGNIMGMQVTTRPKLLMLRERCNKISLYKMDMCFYMA